MLQMIEEDRNYYMKESASVQKTVLVIDDDSENIKCIEQFMQDEPLCNIVNASTGEEALRMLDEMLVHLILLNVEGSEMDGIDVFAQIKKKYDIPTIFIAGNKGIVDILNSEELFAEEYISKPFTSHMIKEVIHSVLNE